MQIAQMVKRIKSWMISNALVFYPVVHSSCRFDVEIALNEIEHGSCSFSGMVADCPEDANVLLVAGHINKKMSLHLETIYNKLRSPKFVVVVGSCALGGGLFGPNDGEILSKLCIEADVEILGCPPRSDRIISALESFHRRVSEGEFIERL